MGLFFDCQFETEGPPFGGSKVEYVRLLETHFDILRFDPAEDSIAPRLGNELFLEARRKA